MPHRLQSSIWNGQYFIRSAIFLVAFVLSGFLSLQLVIPPGFASLIWLPGGLALGMVLIWGLRYLPVIAVGAFILNVFLVQMHMDTKEVLHAHVWLLDACLVLAPLLQVMIAWLLIKLFMDIERPFGKPLNIILFAVFSGPTASLVSATCSTLCLYLFGLVSQDALLLNWFALWVGESIGVLIVTPIMIMLYNSSHLDRKQVYIFFSLPLIAICLSIISVFFLVNRYEFNRVQHLFYTMGQDKTNAIQGYYEKSIHQSADFGEYVITHSQISGSKLKDYVSGLLSHHNDFISMGWMNHNDMDDLIHQLKLRKYDSRKRVSVNTFLPPMMDNKHSHHQGILRVKGSSLSSVIEVLSNTLIYGKPQLIFLDCDLHAHREIGLLIVPIVQHQKVVASVFSLLDFHDDFALLFKEKQPFDQVALGFHNLNFNVHKNLLYTYAEEVPQLLHPKFEITYSKKLSISHQQYFSLRLVSSEWFIKYHYSWLVWSMIVGGLFFCILMEVLLLIVYGQKEIVQAKVDKQAALLEQEEKTNFLLLQSAGEGIFGVNDLRMITFANPAMCDLLGYDSIELIGYPIDKLQLLIKDVENNQLIKKKGSFLLEKGKLGRHQELKIRKYNGEWLWVEAIHSQMKGAGINSSVVMLSNISDQKSFTEKLEKMAHFDLLTGLPNRLSFLEYLDQAINHAGRTSEKLAICFLDMDNFKYVNDRLGHQVGDQVLAMVPELLKPYQRSSDYLSRLSGDEFALILHNVTSTEMIVAAVTRYLTAFDKPFCLNDHEVKVSFSLGVAVYPASGKTAEELLKNADMAMYKAKKKGKNTFSFFNKEASQEMVRYHQINESFKQAIEENQFYLNYQPQLDAKTQEIYGVEALIRWDHPTLGSVEPSEFILVAENSGFIKEIGRCVFEKIAEDYQQLMSIHKDFKISINVSSKQLEDKGFEAEVRNFIENNHIKPESIIVEVTETALMHDFDKISSLMARLVELGIGFALDDFGMEYSSLNYLKNLDISSIKIDKNFVHDMCENKVSAAIISAIVKLALSLNISLIAEGVETKAQYERLSKEGCSYIQGYYFSKPVGLSALLKKWLG
jgi:diguanylate cyclase (GGDEF)-like protein/PAS domain S-box-containing protein